MALSVTSTSSKVIASVYRDQSFYVIPERCVELDFSYHLLQNDTTHDCTDDYGTLQTAPDGAGVPRREYSRI